MAEPSKVQTAEEWYARQLRPQPGHIAATLADIEARERAVRRKALVEAAKATCRYCANELPIDDSKDHIKWYGGGLPVYGTCSAKGVNDLLAKLDAEVGDGG